MEDRPFTVRVEVNQYQGIVEIDIGVYQLDKRWEEAKKEGTVLILVFVVPRPKNCDVQRWDRQNRGSHAGTRSDSRRREKTIVIVLEE